MKLLYALFSRCIWLLAVMLVNNIVLYAQCTPSYSFQSDVSHTLNGSTVDHTWSIKNTNSCAASSISLAPVVYKYTGSGSCACTLPTSSSNVTSQSIGAGGNYSTSTIASNAYANVSASNFYLVSPSSGVYVVLFNIQKSGSTLPFICTYWHGCRLYMFYITPPVVLATPSASSVSLSWGAINGVSGYDIYRGSTYIGSTSGTTFTATGLSSGTAYTFKVQAYLTGCSSAPSSGFSNYGTVSTSTTCTPLAAPTNVSATDGTVCNSVNITWSGVSGASYYNIYKNGSYYTNTSSTSYTDNNASTSNTQYTIYAMGGSCGNNGGGNNYGYAASPLAVPQNVSATDGTVCNSVNITWSGVSGASYYDIYKNGSYYTYTYSTSYTDNSASTSNTQYTIYAMGGSCGNSGGGSNYGYAAIPLAVPQNVSATDAGQTH